MSTNIRYISKDGKDRSIRVPIEVYEYILSTRGRWELLIANEKKEVKAGNIYSIKIKPVELYPEEIALPCPVSRHALVSVISVSKSAGRPQKVEVKRVLDVANVIAIVNGKVDVDDCLGVINVFPQATLVSRIGPPLGFRKPPSPYR